MPTKPMDITNHKYGRLTAIRYLESRNKNAYWLFKCDCGNEKVTSTHSVRSGNTLSCGCIHREQLVERNHKHGLRSIPEYSIWLVMKDRCLNKENKDFHHYGGRGITIHQSWIDSFEQFYKDVGPRPGKGFTIDRTENSKGYEPGNCKWVTQKEQCRNKRNNRYIEMNGEIKSLAEWVEIHNVDYGSVHRRLSKGMSLEDAIRESVNVVKRPRRRSC